VRFLIDGWNSLFSRLAHKLSVRGGVSSMLNSGQVKNPGFTDADIAYGIIRLVGQRARAALAGNWP
jgi:hypothetical protein